MKSKIHVSKKLGTVICLAFLCTAAAHAQNLILEFEVPQGYRVVDVYLPADRNTGRPWLSPEKSDLNYDGIPEVVMRRDDEQGTLLELVVVDVSAVPPEALWTLDLSFLGYVESGFVGFFDVLGDQVLKTKKAAVLSGAGGAGVLVFDPDSGNEPVFSLEADYRLLGVADVDGDGLDELIIDNKVGGVFEVWGAGQTGRSGR